MHSSGTRRLVVQNAKLWMGHLFHLKELMKFKEKDWDLSEVGYSAATWVILSS